MLDQYVDDDMLNQDYEEEKPSLMQYMATMGDEMKESGSDNKAIRFALYSVASRFVHGTLGKGNRKPLPQCVQTEIRDCYPAHIGESYTGFKEGTSTNK